MSTFDVIANDVYQSEELCRCFSFAEIQSMTNNFNDDLFIGKGGFGKVYKGFIDDGSTTVAVKRLNVKSKQGAKEFWTEVKTLSKLRHTNLVTLIGYSDDCDEMILVYEYMANGTLADHLYKISREESGQHLTWVQRLNICIGAANGLDYLHTNTEQSVIHRDVKTTNILLDENWVAKISDFGLSKIGSTSHTQSHVSTDVKGTFGYLDPAYFLNCRLTKKSDVYAFGVVLFEVLCARPPVDTRLEEEQHSLALWAQHCIKKGTLNQIIDSSLRGQISPNCLKVFADFAKKCLHNHPKGRPTMVEVVGTLEALLVSQDNIPQRKGIITKVFLSVAQVAAKGLDLRWRILKGHGSKNEQLWKVQRNPLTTPAIQLNCRFSLEEIRVATNNFHERLMIGQNAYSTVYKGRIRNLEVAIKRWTEETYEWKLDQIKAEMIQVQSQLRHLHIVSLIGFCDDKNEVIFVYEYMCKGVLYNYLYRTNNDFLSWEKRLKICIGIARGLQYLHAGTKQTFIHRNLKSINVLLDENWVAKVSGFELSTVLPVNESSSTLVAGTVGYLDPEYYTTAKLTVKSDVYSFGVILLELLCGRKPMVFSKNEDQVNLVCWFKTNIEMGTIDKIIDPCLINNIAPECLKEYVKIAENCVCDKGIERPSMDDVLGSLWYALQLQKTWPNHNKPGSHINTFLDGIEVVDIANRGGIDGMSFTSLGDSDYLSNNLAR